MEAVAAVASVAGIICLVGQTLDHIIKLRGFYQECSEASGSVSRFLKALNGLIQIHEDVRDLMRKLENTAGAGANDNILASLQIQIHDCGKDVGLWLEKASACQPMAGSGTRATFRKFQVALEKRKIVDINQEIANHRDNISIKLSVIGRHLDINQSAVLEKISTKLDDFAEARKLTAEAFEKREANSFFYSGSDTYDINSGHVSLASIAGSLSRIESVLGSWNGSVGSFGNFKPTTHEQDLFGPIDFDDPRHYDMSSPVALSDISDQAIDISNIGIGATARDHLFYQNLPDADGFYHCPWEGQDSCHHKPEKLKCNYDKFIDSHLKPYRCTITACEELRFSSTACLLRHERESHNMHGHGDKPFLCTFEGCDRSVPGNGFPRHWNLRDHMRRVHNEFASPNRPPILPPRGKKRKADSELETQPNKKSGFLEFNAIIAERAKNCLDSQINDYIHLLHLRLTLKTWIEGTRAMPWLYSEKTGEAGDYQNDDLSVQLQQVQSEIDTTRQACWAAGENVDDIEILLKIKDNYSINTPWESPQKKILEQDELPALQEDPDRKRTRIEASKQDRISLWLLENLRASPNEAIRHRSYLGASADIGNQEWARAVLKYWLLDGAAVGHLEQASSTNGAVDSEGMCHSARLVFENYLPFPVTEADKDPHHAERFPGNLGQKIVFLEGDEMSLTSTHSTRSFAHRQKRTHCE